MTLDAGTKLDHYEILEPIGKGGMGEVYRARDTKLGREVAIKVLPEELSQDRERRERFEREAKLLASLNHPAIATLYGFEDGFLVMELVEGETLAERIARGALQVDEAIPLFIHIAEGLEAAHEKGVIHRDLKPPNIMIGPDGSPKILDFGLAKAFSREENVSAEASQSPTLTKGTALGVIMGTASYMSPEQARGKKVDKRTDVWAFGCCLYEALTGKKAFDGETVTDIIAAVVNKEPRWENVPAGTPPNVRELLRRTLNKNTRDRLHDIADARIELETSTKSEKEETAVAGQSEVFRWIALVGALGLVCGLVFGWLTWGGTATSKVEPAHLSIELLPADVLGVTTTDWIDAPMAPLSRTAFALSPNGRDLVFAGRQSDQQQLFHRPLGEDEARPIPGTDNAVNPFFSPDGEWLGFWSDRKLKKVELSGGPPVSLCDAQHPVFGASWTTDGRIIFAQRNGGLWAVPDQGGKPVLITGKDIEPSDNIRHRLPWVLPGDEAVLFTVRRTAHNSEDIVVQSLVTGEQRVLIEGGADHPIYSPTGHLLYMKLGVLWAVPFDPRALELVGTPKPIIHSVVQSTSGSITEDSGAAQISVSASGTLAYVPGGVLPAPERRLLWADRNGNTERLPFEAGIFWFPRISPDGSRVSVGEQGRILVLDLRRKIAQRLPGVGSNAATWSPDGRHVLFQTGQNGIRNLSWQPADGSRPPEPRTASENRQWPGPWLPDGSAFLFVETRPATSNDILRLDIGQSKAEPTVLLGDPFDERHPALSPDGRWLAYTSDESGRNEVYVRAYPNLDGKQQVSSGGGSMPAWSAAGDELFYVQQNIVERENAVMAVNIATAPTFQPGAPFELFRGKFQYGAMRSYDVADDGRFLMVDRGTPRPRHTSIRVILNWHQELERLVPRDE